MHTNSKMDHPPRVVLAGWYGAANLGDELLLATIAGWVRDAGGTPVAISVHPDSTRAAHGVEAVGYGDLAAIVEAMMEADLFVLGGGGLFQDYDVFDVRSLQKFPSYTVSQYAQFLFLADELGLHTLALAQGVGPLRGAEGRAIASDVFARAGGVSVRDADSASLVREIGVERSVVVAPDPGWAWRPLSRCGPSLADRYPALRGQRVLAMILRDWPFDSQWEQACVAALRDSIPDGWAMLWIDFSRPPGATERGDSEIARRMVANIADRRTHVVWEGERLEDATDLLAQCDACVAMRLHGVLLASVLGLPVIAIEYDGKVKAMGDEIGLVPQQRVGLQAIRNALPAALARTLAHGAQHAFRLSPTHLTRLAEAALAHRSLLVEAMRQGPTAERSSVHTPSPSWLARWISHAPETTPRVVSALVAGLRKSASRAADNQFRVPPRSNE